MAPPPPGVDLRAVALRATYTGSPFQKNTPSFAGRIGRPRPDANICPRDLAWRREDVEAWLRAGIARGACGAFRGDFPQHVWHREGDVVYEAFLTNQGNGEYHGYPLEEYETVRGLP